MTAQQMVKRLQQDQKLSKKTRLPICRPALTTPRHLGSIPIILDMDNMEPFFFSVREHIFHSELNEVIVRVIILVSNGGLNLLSSSYPCPDYEPITNHAGLTSSDGKEEICPFK